MADITCPDNCDSGWLYDPEWREHRQCHNPFHDTADYSQVPAPKSETPEPNFNSDTRNETLEGESSITPDKLESVTLPKDNPNIEFRHNPTEPNPFYIPDKPTDSSKRLTIDNHEHEYGQLPDSLGLGPECLKCHLLKSTIDHVLGSTPTQPQAGGFEEILEMVWLDGAQLAGGSYLGKKTMTVAEALTAHNQAIQEAKIEVLKEFMSFALGKPLGSVVPLTELIDRLNSAIQALGGKE